VNDMRHPATSASRSVQPGDAAEQMPWFRHIHTPPAMVRISAQTRGQSHRAAGGLVWSEVGIVTPSVADPVQKWTRKFTGSPHVATDCRPSWR